MREPENDGKIEAREIKLGAGKRGEERPHGRAWRFFDNLWYHHKWKIIAVLFLAVILIVVIVQCSHREKAGDVALMTAGPYGFTTDEGKLRDLQNCLATYLPEDYDGDGSKRVTLIYYSIYSEEEIAAAAARTDENGNPAGEGVNRSYNVEQYQQYSQHLRLGECSVLFLSPWLFAEQTALSSEALCDLSALLSTRPAGAITPAGGSENGPYFGVRLKDTALWRDNAAIRNALPEDTVLCLCRPALSGDSSKPEKYEQSVAFFKALVP